jgi:uncharacterized repeat protein (TIGR03803 family)
VGALPGASQSLHSQPAFGVPSHRIRKNIQTKTILYGFAGGSDGANPDSALVNVGGTLYGTTVHGGASGDGTIYQMTGSGAYSQLHSFAGGRTDGAQPFTGLVYVGGTLDGTTCSGGLNGDGTVDTITPSGTETVLYNFAGGTDGGCPDGALVGLSGKLYGTTLFGANGRGTIYSVSFAH